MSLKVSQDLGLPLDAARWKLGIVAMSDAGKTYDASVLAEEMVLNGVPIVVFDPLGIWWGLRVGVEGHKGIPVVVFGGKHADLPIPIKQEKGRELIDEDGLKKRVAAILQAGISVVFDTFEFSKSMQRRAVAIFASELYRLNEPYGIRHVFIEEADTVAPQNVSGAAAQTMGAVDDLVKRGGNFNIGVTIITQRPASVNKDVLSQVSCLIALKILGDHDKRAILGWIKDAGDKDTKEVKKFMDSLKDLQKGEAWVWHPPDIFKRVQFRRRYTLHATRDYFLQTKTEPQMLNKSMADVREFVQKYSAALTPKKGDPDYRKFTPEQGVTAIAKLEQQKKIIIDTQVPSSTPRRIRDLAAAQESLKNTTTIDLHGAGDSESIAWLKGTQNYGPDALRTEPTITIDKELVDVYINSNFTDLHFGTDSSAGKIMYVLLVDHQGKLTDNKTMIREINEYQGWVLDETEYREAKMALRDRNIIKEDTGHGRIRLPAKVHRILIDGKLMRGEPLY